ncbi:MAG TPA: UDP-3-O-(3-hydroxymyristoyl)glucosamine N-acyltransferase [Acidobacteriota bacterium]|nr:UDP-3-O-(3-hydroxymyristoyl)glucosamine N-acyltransferase [Acidobacteriota bacterium]
MHTLGELAEHVGGRAWGQSSLEIEGVRPFQEAGPGEITLAGHPRYLRRLSRCRASAAIVPLQVVAEKEASAAGWSGPSLLGADHPKLAFAQVVSLFHRRSFQGAGLPVSAHFGEDCQIEEPVSIHPAAVLGDRVVVGKQTSIGANAVAGEDVRIGRGCTLHPNVVLYPGVRLGDGVVIHSGTVIGADGFGYVFDGSKQFKLEQTGTVVIEDEVEIGANCCVDRATFGSTLIERGVKIDNLVHVGHNCRIGENTVIVGCVGISGSVSIGKNCVLAGQTGVVDHVTIGDGVSVLTRAAVTKDIPSGSVVSGHPARDHRQELKSQALLRRLPQLQQELRRLRRRVRELEVRSGREGAADAD